jgi:hypothetical protein
MKAYRRHGGSTPRILNLSTREGNMNAQPLRPRGKVMAGFVPQLFWRLCRKKKLLVRLQVLTASIMKMTVFWDVAPCCLVKVYRRFRGAYCLHHQGDDR